MMSDEREIKDALKEAMREWLDEKFAEFGRWSMHAILAAALVVLTYLLLTQGGWRPPDHLRTGAGIHLP